MGKYFKVRVSDWIQDFRYINYQDSSELGVCYDEMKIVWITLHNHESFNSIIDTINHESLHQAIGSDVVGEDLDESNNMNIEQEHELIKRVIWCYNDWLF